MPKVVCTKGRCKVKRSPSPKSGCVNMSHQKKYRERNSPPQPANECCNQTKVGNDGLLQESTRNKLGICAWHRKRDKKKSPRKSPKPKSPPKRKSLPKKTSPKKSPPRNTGGVVYFTFKFTPFDNETTIPPATQNFAAIQNNINSRPRINQQLAEMTFEYILGVTLEDRGIEHNYKDQQLAQTENEWNIEKAHWTFAVRVSSKLAYDFTIMSISEIKNQLRETAADTYQGGEEGSVILSNSGDEVVGYFIDLKDLKQEPDEPGKRRLQEKDLRLRATIELMTGRPSDLQRAFNPFRSTKRLENSIAESERLIRRSKETVPTPSQVNLTIEEFQDKQPMFT